MDYIIREIAESMDLDPDKVANSLGEAAIQAEILKKFQEANPPAVDPNAPQAPGAAPGGPVASGEGPGNIGTGSAPVPGEQGFSGNTGGAPEAPIQ
jgi:hypothetical protein